MFGQAVAEFEFALTFMNAPLDGLLDLRARPELLSRFVPTEVPKPTPPTSL